MIGHLVGDAGELAGVALKAFLLYVTAAVGLRLSGRRTLAELSPYDFVAAVAVGAVVGRLPTAADASYLGGALTLATILTAHAGITRLRLSRFGGRLLDPPPLVLVADGQILHRHVRRAGMTRRDLDALLREHGVTEPGSVRLAVLERRGQLSVIFRDSAD